MFRERQRKIKLLQMGKSGGMFFQHDVVTQQQKTI
jgi:hypothetical protein